MTPTQNITAPPPAPRSRPGKRKTKEKSTYRDRLIGARIRKRRLALELTLQALGASIGFSMQQLQKYETGTNRVSANNLVEFSRILGVPIEYFYQDFLPATGGRAAHNTVIDDVAPLKRCSQDREVVRLLKNFSEIGDRKARQEILRFLKICARQSSD